MLADKQSNAAVTTLLVGFPLRLHMLSSAPSKLLKERAGAGDKVYKIVLLLCLSYMAASHRRWVLPKIL